MRSAINRLVALTMLAITMASLWMVVDASTQANTILEIMDPLANPN